MAKLGSFYSLCPLIDNKSLLDVSQDSVEGVVIVTLGKNIASRYKVSDQKQLTCWRTKEKLSSPVFFHSKKNKYLAAFNQSHIKLWDIDDNLDKLKKYKFLKPIHTLIKRNENIFIIFQNGAIHTLDEALDERKILNPVGCELTQIDHILHEESQGQFYFGLVCDNTLYCTKYNEGTCKYSKILLSREEFPIKGYTFHFMRNMIHLLTLWSDGSIFCRSLEDSKTEENSLGELLTIVDSVSSKHSVSMQSLDENYIALYGAASNEEGAMLALYNIQFNVTQSKQPFKLFTTNSKIWRIENNLFVPVGQNLAVIPFHLETEQLAALVGSHKDMLTDPDVNIVSELEIVSWEKDRRIRSNNLPADLQNKINLLVKQGLSESTILEELLPEILEKMDENLLIHTLNHFSDIPEKLLVRILNHALSVEKNAKLMSKILSRSFSEVLILPYLRSDLPIDKVSGLLKSIWKFWSKNRTLASLNYVETHAKLLQWSCVVIDANYQKIMLSKDELLIETLKKFDELVQNYLTTLEELKLVEPLLSNVKSNKTIDRYLDDSNLRYSIEQISFY